LCNTGRASARHSNHCRCKCKRSRGWGRGGQPQAVAQAARGPCSLGPLLHQRPPVCAHHTTFRFRLPPLLIVKSPLAMGDRRCQCRPCRPCRPCCPCHCHRCFRLCLRLPPVGCSGARRRTSCWRNGVGNRVQLTRDGLLRAPQTTIVVRGQEGGGGEDDLEPPTAVARATVAAPTVIVHHDHCRARTSSFLLHHCRCYFIVGVQRDDEHLGGGRRRHPNLSTGKSYRLVVILAGAVSYGAVTF
jgi:hypothetical protein